MRYRVCFVYAHRVRAWCVVVRFFCGVRVYISGVVVRRDATATATETARGCGTRRDFVAAPWTTNERRATEERATERDVGDHGTCARAKGGHDEEDEDEDEDDTRARAG